MARLYDYIIEVQLGSDPKLNKLFNLALKQVYSPEYLSKIDRILSKKINLKEKILKDPNVAAWNKGTTIYVNKPVFYSKPIKEQIKYLLHEFVHLLHHSKNFILLKNFKEMKNLSSKLYKIVAKNSKDVGKFLTGKPLNKKFINSEEVLSYLMNDSINWNYISPQGRQLFINELKHSNMFNLEHPFWKKRLI